MATLGIQSTKASTIKSTMEQYKKHIDKITISSSKISSAIKGSASQAGLKNYIGSVNAKIDTLLNFIQSYETRLDEVVSAYKTNDNSSNTNLASAAKNVTNYKS